ncbi:MAG: cytochrome b, partial [Gammaproteobacteria bacterium]|nr:cytochrome b [Gammaproteobacteria bacterium]NIR94827.1 cytochrome b [Gammaproteobacteria bacterium]NIW43942.1 cytochrome b [Gammaproteobacteria bacterium]NIX55049.1 cytochrome b [candidate division Zixibacteria bacterium]
QLFTDIHVASSLALISLIVLHICGAFSHLVLSHENVLGRM